MCSQIEFMQQVSASGSWNPSIAEASNYDTSWDAAIASFKVMTLGTAASCASGSPDTTHSWTMASSGAWSVIGVDIAP
jgi:hypothetical protein